jgi:hypothetical protein
MTQSKRPEPGDTGGETQSSAWRRLGQYFGLLYADDGRPSRGAPKRSRYDRGLLVPLSPRLDEDIDALRARLDAAERRPS